MPLTKAARFCAGPLASVGLLVQKQRDSALQPECQICNPSSQPTQSQAVGE